MKLHIIVLFISLLIVELQAKQFVVRSCNGLEALRRHFNSQCIIETTGVPDEHRCVYYRIKCPEGVQAQQQSSNARSLGGSTENIVLDLEEDELSMIEPRDSITESEFQTKTKEKIAALLQQFKVNDPKFPNQWFYGSDGSQPRTAVGFDMDVLPVAVAGYTGKGITMLVVDDGMQTDHPEIVDSYDKSLEKNFFPGTSIIGSHGTKIAGLIAGKRNNGVCIAGIAPGVKISAVKILGSKGLFGSQEAEALNHKLDQVDIYSNSWGPSDNGLQSDQMAKVAYEALQNGVSAGRNGKGALYFFASGNGGHKQDSCGADGYINTPFTLPVQSVDESGHPAFYAEVCGAMIVSSYVGAYNSPTTDQGSKCVGTFLGTSAACPMAAACSANILEANPALTWRDMMHVLSRSGRMTQAALRIWQVNAAGLLTSNNLGFGVLECARAVRLAKKWNPVGILCWRSMSVGDDVSSWREGNNNNDPGFVIENLNEWTEFTNKNLTPYKQYTPIIRKKISRFNFEFKSGRGKAKFVHQQSSPQEEGSKCALDIVEQVTFHIKLTHACRGALIIWMTSPKGVRSVLLGPRRKDLYSGKSTFNFKSFQAMGEPAYGNWTLSFYDTGKCSEGSVSFLDDKTYATRGHIVYAEMKLWGTSSKDSAYAKNRNILDPLFLTVGKQASTVNKAFLLSTKDVSSSIFESKVLSLNEKLPKM